MTQPIGQSPANQSDFYSQIPHMNHECTEDSLDTMLIKARTKTQIECSVGLTVEKNDVTYASIPAPKVWRRSSRKQTCSPPTIVLQPEQAQESSAPICEITALNIDEWTRDFLMLALLNEN